MRWIAALFVTFFLLAGGPVAVPGAACAQEKANSSIAPHIPRGLGDKCVADTPTMRRRHMSMLMHQRDKTVHEGVRTKQHSLENCLGCHAVKGDDGKAVAYEDSRHFCRSCHTYVAVKIDCFECHNSRPEVSSRAAQAPAQNEHAALETYLREIGR